MKKILNLILLCVCVIMILAAGCTTTPAPAPASAGNDLLARGEMEFSNNNLHAAEKLFVLAQENFTRAGDTQAALNARNRASIAHRLTVEFPYNRSQIEAIVATGFPDVPAERRASWLPCNQSQCITSDGETWYFANTVPNIRYHNIDLMQKALAARGETPFYDQLKSRASAPALPGSGPYLNPVTWEGTEVLSIPAADLPKTGTLRLWIPLPVETDSQKNVTIISVEPTRYLTSRTGTGADLGLASFEIPLDQVTGDFLNITAKFRFTAYEQRFVIDPAKVGSYNTSDSLYRKYTAPGKNIAITPEITATAQRIVGNETNPYHKAQKINVYVVSRPYSLVPHSRLNAGGTMEAAYVQSTGFGDCGTQSMYFAALCRAAGIPARAVGGRQMVPGYAGDHFWSEYYLPGYGWVPNDVTIAEGAEWSFDATGAERDQYRQYYSQNLDPYRYIIQTDVDIPLTPSPGDAVMDTGAIQSPKAVCDTCMTDPEFGLLDDWDVTLLPV